MRRIVIAALVVAILGSFGLALGLSAADAVERAVAHRTTGVERALSLEDAVIPTNPGAPIPLGGRSLALFSRNNPC